MTDDEPMSQAAGRFVVLGGYGEVMLRFQLLELNFWAILLAQQKRGMTLGQRVAKMTRWDEQTLSRLVRGVVGLPDELRAEAEIAVETRNYLAHRWMRERAFFLDDPATCERYSEELAYVLARLEQFEERLATYREHIGVGDLSDEDAKTLGLADPPSHEAWVEAAGEGPGSPETT